MICISELLLMSCFQMTGGAIKLELVNDSFTELQGEIAGPPDTPYEGGTFLLEIKVPETYPFNPPKVNSALCNKCFQIFCYKVNFT